MNIAMDNPSAIQHGDNRSSLNDAFSELVYVLKSQSAINSEEFKLANIEILDLARKLSNYRADLYKRLNDQDALLDSLQEKLNQSKLYNDEDNSKSTDSQNLSIEYQTASLEYDDICLICEIIDDFNNDFKPFVELSETTRVNIPVELENTQKLLILRLFGESNLLLYPAGGVLRKPLRKLIASLFNTSDGYVKNQWESCTLEYPKNTSKNSAGKRIESLNKVKEALSKVDKDIPEVKNILKRIDATINDLDLIN